MQNQPIRIHMLISFVLFVTFSQISTNYFVFQVTKLKGSFSLPLVSLGLLFSRGHVRLLQQLYYNRM